MATAPASISVYVHFPWCLRKCQYCDFHSVASEPDAIPYGEYAQAVIRELQWRGEPIADLSLESVFFGGGTPSLWRAEPLGQVLKAIFRRFRATVDPVEVTVECNPSSLDRANATAFAAVGVNRLSIGVQSLDAASLRFLGRLHDPESALRAVADAQAAVARVNADVIFGMPGQTPVSLASELTRLVDLGLEHLSVYGLTIEPATRFAALQQQGELELASEDTFTESFREAHRVLEARGFEHYEVSNYAKPGQRARHNLRYWRGEPYLGLGADAVGCLHHEPGSARRYRNQADPLQYIESSHSSDVEVFDEQLGPNDLVREGLMLGLRSHEGVYLPVLARRTGVDPLSDRRMRIEQAVARGDLVRDGDWLKVPPARWLHLDGIIAGIF